MKKARAVFTMQRDEDVFLPIWLKYYRQYFDGEDIYVLDHFSTNGVIEEVRALCRFQCVRYDKEEYADLVWYGTTVQAWQQKLLDEYSCVLFVEPDEVIFADEGLDLYIANMASSSVHSAGFTIIHQTEIEPPIDLSRTILSQRSFCEVYIGKQVLSREPLWWSMGFHWAEPRADIDPKLVYIHLHRMDYGVCKAKNERVAGYKWNQQALERGWGWQTRCSDEAFEHYFKAVGPPGLLPIPAAVKASDAF